MRTKATVEDEEGSNEGLVDGEKRKGRGECRYDTK